jgi:hypothetical protein
MVTSPVLPYIEGMYEPDPDAMLDRLDPREIDIERIESEERAAARRLSAIEAGRRKGGRIGAGLAASMLAVSEIYEGPPQDVDIVAVAEHPGEPGDIDVDGIEVTVGDVEVWAPPPRVREVGPTDAPAFDSDPGPERNDERQPPAA